MKNLVFFSIFVVLIISCKKPYAPPVIQLVNNYLVVEGIINTSADSTIIKLGRAVNISSQITENPELHARVTVESDDNNIYALAEVGRGKYGTPGLMLNTARKYRLRIKTANSEEYLSSFESALNTPPIDSVGFTIQNTAQNIGIQVYVNTHDPKGAVNYYHWDYGETWKFTAFHKTFFITDGKGINLRTADQLIDTCYTSDSSSTIVLGSSAGLTKAIIYQSPITQIPATSEKIEQKYSILVNQYALSAEAYNFWINVKKNTEQLGSIFDAQPSALKGNIQCLTNPSEPVIGFISVATIQRKRLYVLKNQLPLWTPKYPYACSFIDTNYFVDKRSTPPIDDVAENLVPLGSAEIPTIGYYKNGVLMGYFGAPNYCADCTIRGKKNPPAFWK